MRVFAFLRFLTAATTAGGIPNAKAKAIVIAISLAVAVALMLPPLIAGCSRRLPPATPQEEAVVWETSARSSKPRPIGARRSPAPRAQTPADADRAMPQYHPEAEALALEEQYRLFSETAPELRTGVIHALGEAGTPEAAETLARLYSEEENLAMRMEILGTAGYFDAETLEPMLSVMSEALAAGQETELRQAAIETLENIPAEQALPLWQELAADADPTISSTAQTMIARLQAP